MTDYSYAELEKLWIDAGGSKATAAMAAAIAEAESGGNSDAYNPSGASGLWQILGDPQGVTGNPFDPATNAKMAVAKYKQAGDSWSPWQTYSNGAYKAYLSDKTTPATDVPGSPSAQTTAAVAGGSSDCLVPNPLSVSLPVVGSISAGPQCLLSKSNARAFIGAGLMLAGGLAAFAALAVLAAAAGMKALAPAGRAAEAVGGTLLLVPGAEGAGAAISTAGRTARNPAAEGRRRQRAGAREDAELERRMGPGPSGENRDLRVGRGAIRETPAETRRRQAAGRSRARSVSSGQKPASREETGF